MKPPLDLSLYLVTDRAMCAKRGLEATVLAAVRGGATVVQLRDKIASDAEMTDLAQALVSALAPSGVPLIVNDRPEVAVAAGAAGAHVGRDDQAALAARAVLGPDRILGLSLERAERADAVDRSVVDYVGCGPVNATATKTDHAAPIGAEGAADLARRAGLPAVGIGGIDVAAAREVVRAGLDGAAVVSAICAAPDPEAAARALKAAIVQAKADRNAAIA